MLTFEYGQHHLFECKRFAQLFQGLHQRSPRASSFRSLLDLHLVAAQYYFLV